MRNKYKLTAHFYFQLIRGQLGDIPFFYTFTS